MKREAATPRTYLTEILLTSWKHGGELALAAGGIALVGLSVLVARSQLHLKAFDGRQVLLVLVPLIGMAALFVVSKAAWRLHRRQDIALATTRSLLVLNAADRADFERSLRDQLAAASSAPRAETYRNIAPASKPS
jgi:hypothetical protein